MTLNLVIIEYLKKKKDDREEEIPTKEDAINQLWVSLLLGGLSFYKICHRCFYCGLGVVRYSWRRVWRVDAI